MSLISTYTSNTPNDIREMTFVQYQKILKKTQKKINFQLKLFYLQFGNDLEKEDYPWETEENTQKDRVYMSDLQGLLGEVGG